MGGVDYRANAADHLGQFTHRFYTAQQFGVIALQPGIDDDIFIIITGSSRFTKPVKGPQLVIEFEPVASLIGDVEAGPVQFCNKSGL